MPYDSHDWYWRFNAGLPARPEDSEAIGRFAPELFSRNFQREDFSRSRRWHDDEFWSDVIRWATAGEWRPLVTVREGSCPEPNCPLKLGRPPKPFARSSASAADGDVVAELMRVSGGFKAKINTFLDAARTVHGGKGSAKDLLVTDPYIYFDEGEDGSKGGTDNFLKYLDVLNIPTNEMFTIFQPPYAKGDKVVIGDVWRTTVKQYGDARGYKLQFKFFRTNTGIRFHDRFYLARHGNGLVSGLFGPSMSGLTDSSFVLIGELETMSLRQLCGSIEGWS
ncbi:hypothetical protein [Bradyrhizobium sp. S69]|uniref:hypothetical protein n=1 Tax=Bradyrhizobium sp. S69 TaxID=1641856 RepID=UPI00131B88C0|nr:hypothetical protein [Bradyrhizobium sp. S69]